MRSLVSALAVVILAAPAALAADSSWTLTPMVRLAGGEFLHPGSNDGLKLYVDAFEMEVTPVTWRQYRQVLGDTEHWTPILEQNANRYPPDAPVTYVTWDNADAYATAVGRRLPTELEWEYAAAGGHKREPFKLSPEEAAEMTWYGGAKKEPKIVGQGKPNAYGLYDMHGNVWEWVDDLRGNYARTELRDPNPANDNLGCGNTSNANGSYAWFLRSAVRSASRRDQPMRFRGFRCAR